MADTKLSALTEETTPVDDDLSYLGKKSGGSWLSRKVTWANIKAFLKAYFDNIYPPIALVNQDVTTSGSPSFSGTLTVTGNQLYASPATWSSESTSQPQNQLRNFTDGATGAGLIMVKSRGSLATPTAVQNGDTLGDFTGFGYQNSAIRQSSLLRLSVDGVPAGNNVPGRIDIWLDSGSGIGPVGTWKSTGNLLVGTTTEPATASRLVIKGSTSDGTTDAIVVQDSTGAEMATIDTDGTLNAVKFSVNGAAGANFSGAVTNITVVDGIVTSAS